MGYIEGISRKQTMIMALDKLINMWSRKESGTMRENSQIWFDLRISSIIDTMVRNTN